MTHGFPNRSKHGGHVRSPHGVRDAGGAPRELRNALVALGYQNVAGMREYMIPAALAAGVRLFVNGAADIVVDTEGNTEPFEGPKPPIDFFEWFVGSWPFSTYPLSEAPAARCRIASFYSPYTLESFNQRMVTDTSGVDLRVRFGGEAIYGSRSVPNSLAASDARNLEPGVYWEPIDDVIYYERPAGNLVGNIYEPFGSGVPLSTHDFEVTIGRRDAPEAVYSRNDIWTGWRNATGPVGQIDWTFLPGFFLAYNPTGGPPDLVITDRSRFWDEFFAT